MDSILQNKKECYVCGNAAALHSHHIFYGTANRKQSEKYGMKCWLCAYHHLSDVGVHFDKNLDMHLKKKAQRKFEELHGTRKDFIRVFGKSYL